MKTHHEKNNNKSDNNETRRQPIMTMRRSRGIRTTRRSRRRRGGGGGGRGRVRRKTTKKKTLILFREGPTREHFPNLSRLFSAVRKEQRSRYKPRFLAPNHVRRLHKTIRLTTLLSGLMLRSEIFLDPPASHRLRVPSALSMFKAFVRFVVHLTHVLNLRRPYVQTFQDCFSKRGKAEEHPYLRRRGSIVGLPTLSSKAIL